MKIQPTYFNPNSYKYSQKVNTQSPVFKANDNDTFEISVGYVNDIHGQINNMIRILSGIKGDLRLSAGDINTGSENQKDSNLAGIEFLNQAKIHATTIGNHEMDTTQADLYDIMQHYKGQVLVANMHKTSDWQNKSDNLPQYRRMDIEKLFAKSTVVEIKGENIGLIGVSPIDLKARITDPQYHTDCIVDDLDVTIKDIQEEIDKLKEQGINKICLVSHLGLENDKKVAQQTDGIDVIVSGHTHELLPGIKEGENLLASKSGDPVILTEAGKNGNYFGLLNLTFDKDGIIIKAQNNLGETKLFDRNLIDQAVFENILGKFVPVGYVKEVLPAPSSKLEENPHVNFVCDAMKEMTDADIAIWQVSGIRSSFKVGDVDSSEIKEFSPFADKLGFLNMSEATLVKAFNYAIYHSYNSMADVRPGILGVSGLEYTIDTKNKKLASMSFVDKDGNKVPIDVENPSEDKTYKVIADSFFLFSGADFLKIAEPEDCIKIYYDGKFSLTCQYIRQLNQPIVINQVGRIKYID